MSDSDMFEWFQIDCPKISGGPIRERVAMMISGHKTGSVFGCCNIVSDHNLKMATAQHALTSISLAGTICPYPIE